MRRVGIILFENFTLLGMLSKADAERWVNGNKHRIIKIFRMFNQVTIFTDQEKLAQRREHNHHKEETVEQFIEYLHSEESSGLYKGS